MDIESFDLERWFAKYEHEADIMLAESGIRSLDTSRFDLDIGSMGYVIPTNGDPEFRERIGRRYQQSKENVLFTTGAQEANFLVFFSLLDRDDHAIVITPTYQALSSVPKTICNVSEITLEPPAWTVNIDAVQDAIRSNTKLIVIVNPNNPTGRYHSRGKIQALYDLAVDNDAYLLCDEVYRLLAEDPLSPVANMGPHGISTTSLTKAYGLAGARFGWIVGPTDVIDDAWKWKDYTTISPSLFGQYIGKQALGEKESDILMENRSLARRNRDIVQTFIDDHNLSWHTPVGVHGFVTVPDGFTDAEEFCLQVVNSQNVVLAPGNVFGFDQYFRIGFGLPTPQLEEGLERVSTVINQN